MNAILAFMYIKWSTSVRGQATTCKMRITTQHYCVQLQDLLLYILRVSNLLYKLTGRKDWGLRKQISEENIRFDYCHMNYVPTKLYCHVNSTKSLRLQITNRLILYSKGLSPSSVKYSLNIILCHVFRNLIFMLLTNVYVKPFLLPTEGRYVQSPPDFPYRSDTYSSAGVTTLALLKPTAFGLVIELRRGETHGSMLQSPISPFAGR